MSDIEAIVQKFAYNGTWNWDQVQILFPADICEKFKEIFPPTLEASNDSIFWTKTSLGTFPITSTIEAQTHTYHLLQVDTQLWNKI